MTAVAGKVCVVTGAGSGIGRALALGLARRGARLALSDVNEAGLQATAADAGRAGGGAVHTQVLDVSDREGMTAYAATVASHFGVVHQIYNNAGIAHSNTILESEYEEYERVFGINLWGVIHGTKAFLPHVIASGDGHVINVSSLNGFLAQPDMSHYCTTKFAVRGFTETLRSEMRRDGHRVGVTVVHPGGIKTNIASAALNEARASGQEITPEDEQRERLYNEKLLKMDPAQAAEIIIKAVETDRPRVMVGNDAKLVDFLVRMLPARHQTLFAAAERRMRK
ncbi:Putative oxidoreductase SadH [Paraconexibacter sp. AEG42_29]|uniref:Oxidoreductase SadH n=1 Tax=Paraconexibacter sp. AEG42_29 TaxID=2997339 RepID=A0AAU7AZ61_9ACTN